MALIPFERDKALLRFRHIAATLFYGFAWLSMVALIAMVAIAERLLDGEAKVTSDAHDADTIARMFVLRQTRR